MRPDGSGGARTRDQNQASETTQTLDMDEPGTTG
jgi:hypothetical protein